MELGPCITAAVLATTFPVTSSAQKPHTLPRPVTIDDLFQIHFADWGNKDYQDDMAVLDSRAAS